MYLELEKKKNQLIKVALCFCLTAYMLLFSSVAFSTSYFVSTSGNNSSSGTEANPWKTITYAVSRVNPGDVINVKAGNYYEQVVINKSGTSLSPITFKGMGTPTIRDGSNNVKITGQHIIFDNFRVRNTSRSGIDVSASNVQIRNCIVHQNAQNGIILRTVDNVTVYGGKIYNNGDVGIRLHGKETNIVLDGIEIYSTGAQEAGIKSNRAGGTRNLTMKNLYIHDHPRYGLEILAEGNTDNWLYDVFLEDCYFDYNGNGPYAEIPTVDIKFRSANVLIQRVDNGTVVRSIFERGQGWGVDIYTSRNYKVHNNLFLNNYDSQPDAVGPGFALEINASNNTEVYNNTFYGNHVSLLISYIDSGHEFPVGPFNVKVHNNIYRNSRSRDYQQILTSYSGITNVTRSNELTGVNPRFVDAANGNFRLQASSPAIDAGRNVNVPFDYDGVARPQGARIDMGMFEYCSTSCGSGVNKLFSAPVPLSVEQGEEIVIPVDYQCAQETDLVVLFQLDGAPWTGFEQVTTTLNEGAGTEEVSITIPLTVIPEVNRYQFQVFLAPVGGGWDDRLDNIETKDVTVTEKEIKGPYLGTPVSIPGIIQAENYDFGGQGISYNDLDPVNNGADGSMFRVNDGVDIGAGSMGNVVGWTQATEWLEYTVSIEEAGDYDMKLFYSSNAGGGEFGMSVDGIQKVTGLAIPSTGGWDVYANLTESVSLNAGEHVIRVNIEKAGFNLDRLEFVRATVTNSQEQIYAKKLDIFPNPSTNGVFNLNSDVNWEVFDMAGILIKSGTGRNIDLKSGKRAVYLLKVEGSAFRLLTVN